MALVVLKTVPETNGKRVGVLHDEFTTFLFAAVRTRMGTLSKLWQALWRSCPLALWIILGRTYQLRSESEDDPAGISRLQVVYNSRSV